MALKPAIRVGVSGWRYAPWGGRFYPKGLPQRAELEYAALFLKHRDQWLVLFPAKSPRRQAARQFFASEIFKLREKLEPILWQLPPNFAFDAERLARFLALLPRDLNEAAALARKRDAFTRGRVALRIDANHTMRYALEVRHESFNDPRFVHLLREHNVALVIAETARRWPMLQDITADFVYLRLHGDKKLYRSAYSDKALVRWAERISAWSRGGEPNDAIKAEPQAKPARRPRTVHCFFEDLLERDFVGSALVLENGTHLSDERSPRIRKIAAVDAIVTNAPEDHHRAVTL
jgi:uncharacterized protein YecE (DUF72 family)